MKFWHRLFILFFMFALFAPGLQMRFDFLSEEKLYGAEVETEKPRFSRNGWLSGDFQKKTEEWLAENIGFRGHMIKTDNQINFSLFKEITGSKNTPMVLGIDNYLYEKGYLDNFNRRDTANVQRLETIAKNLKQMQSSLAEKGIVFLLVISPLKTSVYPEYIPKEYIDETKLGEETNYDKIIPLLDKFGINYLDGRQFFLERKKSPAYPLFVKSGTHWSYYGACLFSARVIEKWEELSKRDLVNIFCDPPVLDERPEGTDKDLANLLNIWTEAAAYGPTPHPRYSNNAAGREFKPKVLLIGDSFSYTLMAIMESQKIYGPRNFYYYFNTDYQHPSGISRPIIKEEVDWEKDVFSKDIIMIEASETALSQAGFGFVEEVIKALSR